MENRGLFGPPFLHKSPCKMGLAEGGCTNTFGGYCKWAALIGKILKIMGWVLSAQQLAQVSTIKALGVRP